MSAEQFDEFVRKLESFGFKVYQNSRAAYMREAVFTDGKDIGRMCMCLYAGSRGVQFYTVCYPHREVKTGYRLQSDMRCVKLEELTEQKAREAFALMPPWVKDMPEGLHKYDDFEHWKRHSFLAKKYLYDTPAPFGKGAAA